MEEDPLEERCKVIEKILEHMKKAGYKDEDTFLRLKAQTFLKNTNLLTTHVNLKNLIEMAKKSEEYSELFEEIELLQSKTGDQCCITQEKIIDPWENTCGHFYEREVVLVYKKKNKKCPVVGCSATISEVEK
ncbi:Protein involved in DNA repair [Pseudoloma neurophilia]|uniref:Protein involved in DNA repair n=1 Tax=Pseudoloma neurophilia TaxID=146866 RepID=A0A0R0LRE4_9MICR|nr:Protein involved in DNA repair [Pseudoloma neurophilia]